jgi:hypothetical protein
MALINVGTTANDGTGDSLRTAFQAINGIVKRTKSAYASGVAYLINPSSFSGSGSPVAAEEVYLPLFVEADVTITALTLRSVAGGATNMKLALYADSAGAPAAKIVDLPSAINFASSGVNVTATFTTPQLIEANKTYWVGYITDTATAAISVQASADAFRARFFGASATGTTTTYTGLVKTAGVYATGLPSTPSSLTMATVLKAAIWFVAQ